jgi:ketosteroid isomerase-like protein
VEHIENDKLNPIITKYIEAVNAFDTEAIVATFADNAFVNDVHREFQGIEAIKKWIEKEIVGVKVTIAAREIVEHYDSTIVRGAYDGEYDKTNLPTGDLILTNYFTVYDGKITSLIIIRNTPAE